MADQNAPWTEFRYAVVDVEGNGQRPPDLVELAIVLIDDGEIGEPLTWLVKPPSPITPLARRIHGISNEQVASAPLAAEYASEIGAILEDTIFVAHNAHVDLGVLTRELRGFQPAIVIDTLKLARRRLPGRPSYKLGFLAEELKLTADMPTGSKPHRAAYDALVCARLLAHIADGAELADLLTDAKTTSCEGSTDDAAPTLF
ncbi:exonuclease domain-containing protein [Nonomuraea rubra]|uniref:DNA polymerase III epsilon subunit-like protein n=1 Tax=Nonomuraea rubra TaxID=46180 RepID=A0A7X0U747_9ACTN|nr:exonuclease domain-containing protein [Nonomuraea rubra]MBB6557100.1 DNA polymerase III epsilon subunit-like protein [Nonomuraea rubra]